METRFELILVCGLGGLGRACLRSLLRFKVPIRCLDLQYPDWMVDDDQFKLERTMEIGDMRNPAALRRAGVEEARSVLLLASDSGVNLEAALQVRLLNPEARVVVRSNGGLRLERHLRQRLPGLALVDPQLLTAGVFANALHTDGSKAAFTLGGEQLRVRLEVLQADSPDDLFSLQGREKLLLHWDRPAGRCPTSAEPLSNWWDLNEQPAKGDHLYWLEAVSPRGQKQLSKSTLFQRIIIRLRLALESLLEAIRRPPQQWNHWPVVTSVILLTLLLAGSAFFGEGSPIRGLLLTVALLKGEYLDALGAMSSGTSMGANHLGVAALALVFALGGTLFTAWLVALVVDWLLARRLGRREPAALPDGSSFVLVVEGGRLATRLEGMLVQRSRARVIRVQTRGQEDSSPSFSCLGRALRQLRHGRCQAAAVLGEDLLANLETALNLQELFPLARMAVKSHSRGRAAGIGKLFSGMEVINPLVLAADAVVATAFGERVREVLLVADHHLLLTEYQVTEGDTLEGKSLDAIAAGYGVMPLSLVAKGQKTEQLFPSLERVLQAGDTIVVLAPLTGLRAVETGQQRPPRWRLELQRIGNGADLFAGKMLLARFLDKPPGEMDAYLAQGNHPRQTPPLHQASGRMLEAGLRRLGFSCSLIALPSEVENRENAAQHNEELTDRGGIGR